MCGWIILIIFKKGYNMVQQTKSPKFTMALYIPHRCPKCFESVTLVQPQHKGGGLKGKAKGHCLNCMDEQEYDLTVPTNKRDLIHTLKSSHP
jgi:hypothetical protein